VRVLATIMLMTTATACGGKGTTIDGGGGAPDARPTADGPPQHHGPRIVYASGYGGAIQVFTMDRATLALTPAGMVTTGAGPSFLAFDPALTRVVAVNESANQIESFTIDPVSGALTHVDATSSHGVGPAHIAIDATGAWALVTNYGDGSAAVVPIAASGTFGVASQTVMPGANAHEVVLSASNTIAYVPCLGDDRVAVYAFDPAAGKLTAETPAAAQAGDGPRHLVLHANGNAYVINETASTITRYMIGAGGALTRAESVSTLPPGATGTNTGAEIAVHPNGKWLYASNRGDDSISVFAINADATLTRVATTKTGGARPRHFSIVPGGDALLVANQDTGNVRGFRIDSTTGLLTDAGDLATGLTSPSFVAAVDLP
jgi:6-phosphogluconolactonase